MVRILRPKKEPEKTVQKIVEGELRFMVSFGNGWRGELVEEVVAKLEELIRATWPDDGDIPRARFTSVGGHYLIDGEYCREPDFDPQTMDRKPGTFPPSWAVTGERRKESLLAERNAEQAERQNALSKQPENLLTAREMDEAAKEPTAKEAHRAALSRAALSRAASKKTLRRKA